uniref:Terminase small subunit n=1 Tax=Dulem virus 42 TaxID=3145760 RepID=A0AAU8BBV9_9CAUD
MNKKSTTLDSASIINIRNKYCITKTKYWRIIKTENVISASAKKAGMGSGFDLKALHNQILQMSENLIKIKLMLNAINNAPSDTDKATFNYEEAKKTHYYNIYKACELKEQLAHWEEILKKHTINPAAKAKAGAKGTGKIETFSSAKITSIKKKLQLEINAIDKKIEDFNNKMTIEIDDDQISKEIAY